MDVEGVLSGCTAKLGLSSLKQEQKEAVMKFLSKRDILSCYPLVLARVFTM